MPKNTINLNALPLGDLPDGGLLTLPGDKVTIKDRVIIHESVEDGRKVVKLYRQVNGPQMIQQLPETTPQIQQGVKRSASPLIARHGKRKQKKTWGSNTQLTADQELRFNELTREKKRASEDIKELSDERELLEKLRASDSGDPDILRQLNINKVARQEADRRSHRIGVLRRALNDELKADRHKGYLENNERGMDHVEYEMDPQLPQERMDYFSQPLMQTHNTVKVEQDSDSNLLGYASTYDSSRQSYAGAPGYQDHRKSMLQLTENIPSYFDTSIRSLPKNTIHPARLSLMNNTAATIPERQSMEPKVLMKVTGENMVPLAKSRMKNTKSITMKQEKKMLVLGETLDYNPRDRNTHVDSWEKIKREHDQDKPEGSIKPFSSILLDEGAKSNQAIAWLDANISSKVHSESARRSPMLYEEHRAEFSAGHEVDQGCGQGPDQAQTESNIVKLGLQNYQDVDEDNTDFTHQSRFAETNTKDTLIEETLHGTHALASDQDANIFSEETTMLEHIIAFQQDHDENAIIEREPFGKHQQIEKRLPDEILALHQGLIEQRDSSKFVESALIVYQEPMDLSQKLTPSTRTLGERSVNIGASSR